MIRAKTFILHINPETGQFDEGQLLAFQVGREVLEIAQEMIIVGDNPAWAVMLSYRERNQNNLNTKRQRGRLMIPAADKPLVQNKYLKISCRFF